MVEAEPFSATLTEASRHELVIRLRNTRWPEVIGGDRWDYGVPKRWLREMIDYWAEEWDWEAEAAAMNRFQQYKVTIDGVPIHFLYAQGRGPDPTPLILTHGWPWTFWDFKDVIEPLSDPVAHGGDATDAFHVIVPSLPGFGFSTPLTTVGIDVPAVANLWVRLMRDVCGYDRFAAHGGDWGALITAHLAHAHAQSLIGAHLALTIIPGFDAATLGDEDYADDEQWMRERAAEIAQFGRSHMAAHAGSPQTLSYAMADSPAGMAAWLWERRRNWSDCDGDVERVFDRDHLCTTAALYWCTGAFTSALRLYYEQFNKPWQLAHHRSPVMEAPTGFALFPKDLVHLPKRVAAQHSNLQRWTVMPRGGHFAAAETPELLTADLRAFFGALS